jgi:hypothetical protein
MLQMDSKIVVTSLSELREVIREEIRAEFNQFTDGKILVPEGDIVPGEAGGRYITKRQAAALANCSISWIDSQRRAGNLTAYRQGKKAVRFDPKEVLSLVKKGVKYYPHRAKR